jgi:hypothetical protein
LPQKFFYDIEYHYDIILEKLNLQTLHIKRRHIDALFLLHAFCGTKYCPSVVEVFPLGTQFHHVQLLLQPLPFSKYLLPMQSVNL